MTSSTDGLETSYHNPPVSPGLDTPAFTNDYKPVTTKANPEALKALKASVANEVAADGEHAQSEPARMWRAKDGLNLFFGGEDLLNDPKSLLEANITHILTVMPDSPSIDQKLAPFDRMIIPALDSTNQDMLQYFPKTNQFIKQGLETGKAVLVHCSAGVSRSTTCVIAFLLSTTQQSPSQLLALIRKSRPEACPNDGFWQQLNLYFQLGMPEDIENCPGYQKWLYEREIETKVLMLEAPPDSSKIWFSDEHVGENVKGMQQNGGVNGTVTNGTIDGANKKKENGVSSGHHQNDVNVRCRKCRRVLANSQFILPHTPQTGSHYFHPYSASKRHYHQKHMAQVHNTSQDTDTPETNADAGVTSSNNTAPLLNQNTQQRQQQQTSHPSASSRTVSTKPTPPCAHIFLEPLSWMRPELSLGKLEGRLECPNTKCGANVGKYAWQGMPCSCHEWVVPAISLARARVDEERCARRVPPLAGGGGGAAAGNGVVGGGLGAGTASGVPPPGINIRMPPGMGTGPSVRMPARDPPPARVLVRQGNESGDQQ